MNKFIFEHRNIGLNPDANKYYFTSIDELINQVKVLKNTQDSKDFIRWSASPSSFNKHQYYLMSEYWSTESRGTDTPLKCKGWWVCGYVYTDETSVSIFNLLPKLEEDYTNHFIERRYMSFDDFSKLTDLEKESCVKEGGIILNKQDW